ncbi:hypothetical protein EG68_03087 [Paragonimus skrjabini miyazakii]|uniref:receptor protein serine/threonine kinase n=1 Tax=Paragonimus skrjabini miyazakii TaxID=59628 RepID=A0A8S9YVG1_9TREM|nr:hypothetical protein EG68_03087 [Paragonimus skrjabini miyazakii]
MLILVMACCLIMFRTNGILAISCMSSTTKTENDFSVRPEVCNEGVEHCLIVIGPSYEFNHSERHSYGCWPWHELKSECPLKPGICHILHATPDNLLKTCCCFGSMCNNETVKYVPILATTSSIENLTRLDKFGVRIPGLTSATTAQGSPDFMVLQTVRTTLSCLAGFLIVFVTGMCIMRFCVPCKQIQPKLRLLASCSRRYHSSGPLQQKLHVCLPFCCHHQCRPCSNWTWNGANPTGAVTNPQSSQPRPNRDKQFDRQLGEVVGWNKHTPESTRLDPTLTKPNNVDSAEWSLMQNLVQMCQLDKRLGRGRFADVWLAYLPHSFLFEPFELWSDPAGQATSSGTSKLPPKGGCSVHMVDEKVRSMEAPVQLRFGRKSEASFTNFGEFTASNNFYQNSSTSELEREALLSSTKPSQTDKLLLDNTKHLSNSSSSVAHLTQKQHPVAVKVFAPTEFRAWSSELSAFRALQDPATWTRSSRSPLHTDLHSVVSSHPNLIGMLAAAIVAGDGVSSPVKEYRLVMEFAERGSLHHRLATGDWIPLSEFFTLSRDIASGLTYLHGDFLDENLVGSHTVRIKKPPIAHRDLKPENILLRGDGSACLSDFGQAVLLDPCKICSTPSGYSSSDSGVAQDPQDPTQTNPTFLSLEPMPKAGTLRYMAPELLDGAINYSGVALLRTDVYSFGLILWELASAVSPEKPGCATQLDSYSTVARPSVDVLSETSESEQFHVCPLLSASPVHPILPRRKHRLPYEEELGKNYCSLYTMRQLVSVEKCRPSSNPIWHRYPPLIQIYRTITECWDPEPEARLTVDCVLERLTALQAELVMSNPR